MGDSKRLRLVVVVVPGGFMVGRGASELEDDARWWFASHRIMICIQQDVSPTCLIPMDDKQYVKPMEISRIPASKPFRYHRAQVVLPFERYSENQWNVWCKCVFFYAYWAPRSPLNRFLVVSWTLSIGFIYKTMLEPWDYWQRADFSSILMLAAYGVMLHLSNRLQILFPWHGMISHSKTWPEVWASRKPWSIAIYERCKGSRRNAFPSRFSIMVNQFGYRKGRYCEIIKQVVTFNNPHTSTSPLPPLPPQKCCILHLGPPKNTGERNFGSKNPSASTVGVA